MLERLSSMVSGRGAPRGSAVDHGPSRIVWVFRINGPHPLAIGKLFVIRSQSSPLHLLHPRRRLAPGRYELMFARYGVRWPVILTPTDDPDEPHAMLVAGRVPL